MRAGGAAALPGKLITGTVVNQVVLIVVFILFAIAALVGRKKNADLKCKYVTRKAKRLGVAVHLDEARCEPCVPD